MVDAQLHFEAILCEHVWATHNARIVDENVQFILFLLEASLIEVIKWDIMQ